MKKDIYQDLDPEKRVEMLEARCYEVSVEETEVPIPKDELEQLEKEVANDTVKLHGINVRKAKAMEVFKVESKPYKESLKENTEMLANGFTLKDQKVYLIDDQVNQLMEYYDENGTFIKSRSLRPIEKQLKINKVG